MGRTIYLDQQATTALDPLVLEAMMPWLVTPANASSEGNAPGRRARDAVERARRQIATLARVSADAIYFTSGATEAANVILRSFNGGGPYAISAVEHACVHETVRAAPPSQGEVTIGVDVDGLVDLDALEAALDMRPSIVAMMAVNNEVGTVQPVRDAADLCRAAEVPLFSDCAQALGKIDLDLDGVSFAAFSAHKMHSPQGIGALYAAPEHVRQLRANVTGGGQEKGLRSGTVPVALCVGFGEACRIASHRMDDDRRHAARVSSAFLERLEANLPGVRVNGPRTDRLPHNLSLTLPGTDADALLAAIPDVALSTGSACASGAIAPSRTLLAIGLSPEEIASTIRVGFGRDTDMGDALAAADMIANAALAQQRPLRRMAAGGRR